MKKISLVMVLILAGFLLSGCGKKTATQTGQGTESQTTGQEQSFTGKIKDALLKGASLKCTWENGETVSVGYIKEKKYYGEITNKGKTVYMLLKDNCLWTCVGGKDNQKLTRC